MQGERASLGSLSGALNFEHGSTSSNAVIDQQIRWENSHSLGENEFQDYMIPPNGTNSSIANSIYHEQRDSRRFGLDEASSSGTKGEVPNQDEQRAELGSFEERRNVSIDLNPLFVQSSSSHRAVQSINLNTEYIGNAEDMAQVLGYPGHFEANGPGNEQVSPGRSFEESSGRAGSSLGGRRASSKRKALEGSISQSSSSRGCRDFHCGESSSWAIGPAFYSPGNGLNIPGSLDQGPRGLAPSSIPNFPVPVTPESSHRNFCLRINPSDQQVTMNSAVFSAGSVVRRPVTPSLPNSSRLLPVDQRPLDSRHGHGLGNVVSQNLNAPAIRVQPIFRNVPSPFHWSGGHVLGGSSSSVASVDRISVQQDETRSRSLSRNILENPLFVPAPDSRNLARNQTNRNMTGGNINIAGNIVSSSSRAGSSSTGVHPSPSNSASIPPRQNNHSRYQRRMSELVRRSLISSLAVEPANQSSGDHPALHSTVPPAPPDELGLQSSVGNSQVHSRAHTRAAPWLERHGDRMVGIPHSLRVLASASRGRNRLVASEIRNILELMRRGENLRVEDVMLLDQSVRLGVADIHDRYRDMRLDVDNMSYEELLALEERIGDVCTGLSEETISNRLKRWTYKCSDGDGSLQETEPCCICREEYREGEDMGGLECRHEFHCECIKEWLKRKNLCPICKTAGLNTTEKSTG